MNRLPAIHFDSYQNQPKENPNRLGPILSWSQGVESSVSVLSPPVPFMYFTSHLCLSFSSFPLTRPVTPTLTATFILRRSHLPCKTVIYTCALKKKKNSLRQTNILKIPNAEVFEIATAPGLVYWGHQNSQVNHHLFVLPLAGLRGKYGMDFSQSLWMAWNQPFVFFILSLVHANKVLEQQHFLNVIFFKEYFIGCLD